MDLKMSNNENALWLSVLFLAILTMFVNLIYLELLMYWIVVLIFIGNAKRIHSSKYRHITTIVRRSMYILPFIIPSIFNYDGISKMPSFYWVSIGIGIGILFILPKLSTWRIVLSNDYIALIANKNKFYYGISIYTLVGGAISEELFFRYYILSLNNEHEILVLNIIISAVFFMLAHYGTKWSSKFSKYDFLIQILFGFISAILFILSGSIVPSIIAHLIYNAPHVISDLKCLFFIRGNTINLTGSNKNG